MLCPPRVSRFLCKCEGAVVPGRLRTWLGPPPLKTSPSVLVWGRRCFPTASDSEQGASVVPHKEERTALAPSCSRRGPRVLPILTPRCKALSEESSQQHVSPPPSIGLLWIAYRRAQRQLGTVRATPRQPNARLAQPFQLAGIIHCTAGKRDSEPRAASVQCGYLLGLFSTHPRKDRPLYEGSSQLPPKL